jgi:hypothetical protein
MPPRSKQAAPLTGKVSGLVSGPHSDVYYLWLLLALELLATAWLRQWSRYHHGG